MDEVKSVFRSKLNWLGAATMLAPFADPIINAIPPDYRPVAVSVVGLVTVVLRTFFTKKLVALRPE